MKNKYLIGGAIIVLFLVIMGYLFTQTKISYENDFSKVMRSGRTVRATGEWVREKNYFVDKKKRLFVFYLKDAHGNEMKVVYKGTIPNNFESSTSVVVTGKYKHGHFEASNILTKCPSKYQEEYNKESSS